MNRREVLAGAALAFLPYVGARAQSDEIVVGALYPMTGASAQIGVDASNAIETAVQIVNGSYDFPLPTAQNPGLRGLGDRKIRVVLADHQGDPQKGRAEAERLITQERVVALMGAFHSSVSATASAVCERYHIPYMNADASSPTLTRRGLKFFFRPSAHDEIFSKAMFDFLDHLRSNGQQVKTVAIFHEDTIYGSDSASIQAKLAAERGYQIAARLKYRANSPSLTSEVLQLRSADADVVLPSSYTTDSILFTRTMAELGYQPRAIIAQGGGFADQATYDAVGDKLSGIITRASVALDMKRTRPMIGAINQMYRDKANKDLNDNTSRELMGLILLADAIDRAKSTEGGAIRNALAVTSIPGENTIMPWKRVSYDDTGQNPDADVVLLQYVNGNFVSIYPDHIASAKPLWPTRRS